MLFIKKNKNCGFSMVEMLIVIAIFGIIASASGLMLNGTRNKIALEDAQATVLNALEKARSRAATGVGTVGLNHGIYIMPNPINKIFSFEGSSWSGTGQEISLPPNISIIDPVSDTEIIFNRLSVKSTDTTITIENTLTGEIKNVVVTQDGTIRK